MWQVEAVRQEQGCNELRMGLVRSLTWLSAIHSDHDASIKPILAATQHGSVPHLTHVHLSQSSMPTGFNSVEALEGLTDSSGLSDTFRQETS